MSDDLLSRLGKVAREQEEEACALEDQQPDVSELVRARVFAQAQVQLAPPKRPVRRVSIVAGALAAAALLMLVWLRPAGEPLPAYALTVSGNLDEMRGPSEADVLRFNADSQVELLMRPADDVHATPELRLWLEQNGRGRRLPTSFERSQTGTLRIAKRARELFAESPGKSRLTIFVCLPSECAARERTLHDGHDLPAAEATQIAIEYLP